MTNDYEKYFIKYLNLSADEMPNLTPVVNTLENRISNKVAFDFYTRMYDESVTNRRVINQFVTYIIGAGIKDVGGIPLEKYISKSDFRNICYDLKQFAQFSVKVYWSQGSVLLDVEPEIVNIKWIDTTKLEVQENAFYEVDGYFYSRDWDNELENPIKFYPKFTGSYKYKDDESSKRKSKKRREGYDIEIITFSADSREPYFPKPDYYPGLQYAHIESKLATAALSHIDNGFSAGTIINLNNGIPATEEEKEMITKQIIDGTTGATNNRRTIVSFNEGAENEITVKSIEIPGLDTQLVFYTDESEKKIMLSHGIGNPILFGDRNGGGLGNNADEMNDALKHLQYNKIFYFREIILNGLESILKHVEPNINLEFDNFIEEVKEEDLDSDKNNADE
jgi:hypothetical protein